MLRYKLLVFLMIETISVNYWKAHTMMIHGVRKDHRIVHLKWTRTQIHICTCFCGRSITASLKSAPSIMAPARSLLVRTDLTSTAFVRFASFRTCSRNLVITDFLNDAWPNVLDQTKTRSEVFAYHAIHQCVTQIRSCQKINHLLGKRKKAHYH